MMQWLVGLCVRQRGAVAALCAAGAGARHLGRHAGAAGRVPGIRSLAGATSRPRRRASRPSKSRNWSPGRSRTRSMVPPGLPPCAPSPYPACRWSPITFNDGIDLHVARQGISERLSELGSALPGGVAAPKLSPLVSSTMDLLKVGLVSDKVDAYALRDAAEWVVKPRLLAVPGVAHAIVFGGDVRADPDSARSMEADCLRHHADRAGRRRAQRAGAARRRIHRPGLRSASCSRSPTPTPDVDAIGAALVAVRNDIPSACAMSPTVQGGAGIALRRRPDHGQAGRVAVARQPVRRQHARRPRMAVEAGAGGAGTRAAGAGHHGVSGPAPPGQFHRARTRRSRAVAC